MNTKRILIVDDDASVLEMLKIGAKLFCPESEIAVANNGLTALTQLEAFNQTHSCDLILTDYNMPVMDGLELTYIVNTIWPNTRVVLMSGSSSTIEMHDKISKLKIDAFIKKPFGFEQLKQLLQS